VSRQVAHGRALLAGLPERGRALDLGSGGGLPGLVLATYRPELELTLLEAAGGPASSCATPWPGSTRPA